MVEFETRFAFEHLDKLAYEIGPRLAGTQGDRSAIDYISRHFEGCGLRVRRQRFRFVDRSARRKVTAFVLGLAFVFSLFLPPVPSLATWLAALGIWRSLGVLMPKRRTQNIIATLRVKKPKSRVAVTAHFDSAPCMVSYRVHIFLRFAFSPLLMLVTLTLVLRTLGFLPGWFIVWVVLGSIFLPVCVLMFIAASGTRVSPGAYDNASGVAVMLESARALAMDPPSDVELTFIAFGAEEQGLFGARKLVASKQLRKDTLTLNLDGVGAGSRVCMIEGTGILRRRRTSPELNGVLARSIRAVGLEPEMRWAPLAGYDHIPLVRAGMKATTLTMEVEGQDRLGRLISKVFSIPNVRYVRGYRYTHTPEDTPEKIELANIERAGRIVLEFIEQIRRQVP